MKKKWWLWGALIPLALCALAWSGRQVWQNYQEERISDEQMDLKPDVPLAATDWDTDINADTNQNTDTDNSGEEALLPNEEIVGEDGPPLASPAMDFTKLQAANKDIKAWLTVEGIGVDYPIVQSSDNVFYLTHTAEKKSNSLGALFLDFRDSKDFSDFNSVVYGHNMKSGKMFGTLPRMKEKAYFDKVKTGTLYTPGQTYRLEIFAVVVTDSRSTLFNYIFTSPSDKQKHLDFIRKNAKFYRDIGVTAKDNIITLSTCSYEYQDARTLLIARLVPI